MRSTVVQKITILMVFNFILVYAEKLKLDNEIDLLTIVVNNI